MIRIPKIVFKLCLSLFVCLLPPAVFAQSSMGARGVALGGATTALYDYNWSLFSNPALVSSKNPSAGFYGFRYYGFTEITDISAYGSVPTVFGTPAFGIHRYGDDLFSETRIRAGYKNEWQNLHFGIVMNYSHISFASPYGSGGALGLDAGIAAQLLDQLWIGARATNLNQPHYSFAQSSEDLPRDLAVGFSYQLADKATMMMDILKDVRFPVSYRGGLEVVVVGELTGRVGITTEPLTYSFGMGYGSRFWEVNLAVQQHSVLGLSPGLDMVFGF